MIRNRVRVLLEMGIVLMALVSCEDFFYLFRNPDKAYEGYIPVNESSSSDPDKIDEVALSVSFSEVNTDSVWGADWYYRWYYTWKESSAGFGPIGYDTVGYIKGTIYNVNGLNGERYNSFLKIFDLNSSRVAIPTGSSYDILFYNLDAENVRYYPSENNETYYASSESSDYGNQPGELSGALISGIDLSDNPSDYKRVIESNGEISYLKKIDVELKPYSLIYLIQVIVLNNADDYGDRIIGAESISVSGLARGVDLFTGKTLNDTISVFTDDIKPMQKQTNIRLENNSLVTSANIMAARILTWGLPGIIPQKTSSASFDMEDSVVNRNYIDIDLKLCSGKIYTATLDITKQLRQKPTGGVITVVVDGNDIPDDWLAAPISQPSGYENGHGYVDLGLKVKWATFNIGAYAPEENGDYYAWGETETKSNYSWETYKWCEGTQNSLTKYCNSEDCGYNGFTDGINKLEPEDDVAYVKWGERWRIPTLSDFQELCEKCRWFKMEYNGMMGYNVTSAKKGYSDRAIFIPSAGYYYYNNIIFVGSATSYWSSTIMSFDRPFYAVDLLPGSKKTISGASRCWGYSVRAVCQ